MSIIMNQKALPTTLLHCAGGLKSGYCLGKSVLVQSPWKVTLYLAKLLCLQLNADVNVIPTSRLITKSKRL